MKLSNLEKAKEIIAQIELLQTKMSKISKAQTIMILCDNGFKVYINRPGADLSASVNQIKMPGTLKAVEDFHKSIINAIGDEIKSLSLQLDEL